ncbi:MAG: glycosyltransferase family 9 protein [Verrucomicrobiota bacterium]
MIEEPAGKERVLVIKPSSFGDVIHTLPAVAAIKAAFPAWQLHWLVNEEWSPLLQGNPDLEQVIAFPRKSFRGMGALLQARQWAKNNLAPLQFDRVLDFQGLLRSALLAKASGAASITGFSQAREGAPFFYDEKIELPQGARLHAIDRYLHLAKALGADANKAGIGDFKLPEGEVIDSLPMDRPLIALHPFSRGQGKSLTALEVMEFCQTLQAEAPQSGVLLLGAESWQGETLPANVIDQMGKTSMAQLIWVMRQVDTVVSVDSGPMHLAAAITERLISIHTWTDPAVVGPWQKEAWIWRDGLLLKAGDLQAGQLPEQRRRRALIEQLRQRTGRLLPPGSMQRIAQAAGPGGVFSG